MNPSIKSLYHLLIISSTIACTQPQITPISPEAPGIAIPTDTITLSGYYRPADCRLFITARMTPTGELIPDDTVDPQSCDEAPAAFKVETVRFPNFKGPDRHGLRFTLHEHYLAPNYHFSTENFRLSCVQSAAPDAPVNISIPQQLLFSFASPGRQHLQVFFPDTMLTAPADSVLTASARQYQYNFSFQLVRGRGGAPKFTLLEGTYNPTTDLVNFNPDLANFQNLPDLHADSVSLSVNADSFSSSVQFSSIHPISFRLQGADNASSSVDADSFSSSVRIRSIYHLLTEDFALWREDTDCRHLQNWDLSLIPATGYHLLEVKPDPPFLECLLEGEVIHFRIALLH